MWTEVKNYKGQLKEPSLKFCGLLYDAFTPFLKFFSIITFSPQWSSYFNECEEVQIKMWALTYRFTNNYTIV